jgi:hypothetical protein
MDEIVKQAIKKWPNVPACFGWLGLDSRGDWFMRDERVQSKGGFRQVKGERVAHQKLIDFIRRNYESDALGQYYFQNGPQKVYVELEIAPWVYRLNSNGEVLTHTQQKVEVLRCMTDENGRLYLLSTLGFGNVHSMDMHLAADWVECEKWIPEDVLSAKLPNLFNYTLSPQERSLLD